MNELYGFGNVLIGVGFLFFVFWTMGFFTKQERLRNERNEMEFELDDAYTTTELLALCNFVNKKKGINLKKEIMKDSVRNVSDKDFRSKLEEEIYRDFFGSNGKEVSKPSS
jgi:hypothetical protein